MIRATNSGFNTNPFYLKKKQSFTITLKSMYDKPFFSPDLYYVINIRHVVIFFL